jgi:hypothetical protein
MTAEEKQRQAAYINALRDLVKYVTGAGRNLCSSLPSPAAHHIFTALLFSLFAL